MSIASRIRKSIRSVILPRYQERTVLFLDPKQRETDPDKWSINLRLTEDGSIELVHIRWDEGGTLGKSAYGQWVRDGIIPARASKVRMIRDLNRWVSDTPQLHEFSGYFDERRVMDIRRDVRALRVA